MITIRLARAGAKKHAYYLVVVTNKQSTRDGNFIEQLGTYDPAKPPVEARIQDDRIEHWLKSGAELNRSVAHLLRKRRAALAAKAA